MLDKIPSKLLFIFTQRGMYAGFIYSENESQTIKLSVKDKELYFLVLELNCTFNLHLTRHKVAEP